MKTKVNNYNNNGNLFLTNNDIECYDCSKLNVKKSHLNCTQPGKKLHTLKKTLIKIIVHRKSCHQF